MSKEPIHRHNDLRICGATNVATAKRTFVNNRLIGRHNDPNSHGAGYIIASTNAVFAEGLLVSTLVDHAQPDNLCPVAPPHCNPLTTTASPDTFAGG